MTPFEENQVNRDAIGRFDEKAQSEPEVTLTTQVSAAEALVSASADVWATRMRESEEVAVRFMKTNVPAGVTHIDFEWSDQGEFLELMSFVDADGVRYDNEGFAETGEGQMAGECDTDDLGSAATFIESPFDRGFEDVDGNGQKLRLHVTAEDHASPPLPHDDLVAAGQAAIEAKHALEAVATDALLELMPADISAFRLEEAGSDSWPDYLYVKDALDNEGNPVDLTEDMDLYDTLWAIASHIGSDPSDAAGLERPTRSGYFVLRREA